MGRSDQTTTRCVKTAKVDSRPPMSLGKLKQQLAIVYIPDTDRTILIGRDD
jgi:hypothetical protein